MELRQLKSFIRTAETLNFSEAARQLSISQSTLSQQIKDLKALASGRIDIGITWSFETIIKK